MAANRLDAPHGLLIDRDRPVTFTFDGRTRTGFAGDTITSALWANDVKIISRSFKYHRPRATISAAGHDANGLVQIGDEASVSADTRLVEDGMIVEAQNVVGSLEHDRARYLDRMARFLPVGFYYKAFYKPKGAWKRWEPVIRRMAGLGKVNTEAPHGYFDKQYLWADVAVVGGGPAGMAAALEAAEASDEIEVVLIEENPSLGGALTYARFDAGGQRAARERESLIEAVEARENIRVLAGACCNGWFADHFLPVIQGNRMFKLRAKAVVVATGSYEQPLVFRNNDLPGVMYGSAAQRLVNRYGVKPGNRAVIATANPDGYATALDLIAAGVDVACIADLSDERPRHELADAVADHGIPVSLGTTVCEAIAKPHLNGVEGARVARITGQGTVAERHDTFDCDTVISSIGWQPSANLIWHAGGKTPYNDATAMFEIGALPEGMYAAGSVAGCFLIDTVIEEGRAAGWQAAKDVGFTKGAMPSVRNDKGEQGQNHPWPMFEHAKGKDFIDFDEDLQIHDLNNAVREGYAHVELMKRFSTCGMGPSQGRHSWLNAIRLNARANGLSVNEAGMTTQRPPYTAEKIGVLAGRSFEPKRLTSMHHRHAEAGARLMLAGLWYRPEVYNPGSDREAAIRAEARNVRENVGLIDVSTLGGLEIRGPDAAEMMERMYTWAYRKQQIGRARYTLMTDMTGVITDDGVACRFHDEHYYVTATTSGVDGVYREMLFWNAQWRLKVDVTNVTGAFSGVNIAGPKSREVLARLTDADLSGEGFPYMGVRMATVAGIPCRLLRVGFVGELGFEIHCPAHSGEALWDAIVEAGAEHGIKPFGVECQRLLRLEKGHIIVSQDTDGLTNPLEADMDWALARKRPFFIGKRSIDIQRDMVERKLVGFELQGGTNGTIPKECHLVIKDGEIKGRVTSCSYSPTLDKVIGLAYVGADQAGEGTIFQVRVDSGQVVGRTVKIDPNSFVDCKVVPLPFFDPENARQEL
ncbi:MAG: (2Fe-2S)-binding protein [Rhodospirillales bacterium]|nr:(2Fe-2S)-binding protein [Rhodospirillales bacterium]